MQRAAGVCAASVLLGVVWYAIGNLSARNNSKSVAINTNTTAPPRTERPSLGDLVHEKPAPDPNSAETSDIVVPPDVLAKAELGDHFETINPDLPDTHSAHGQPDAHMFHSTEGNTDPAGGGGTDGLAMDDVIGVGGAASKGTGGGFGGGDGTGVGVGSGAGKGSFGQRSGGGRKLMVKRHGGSKATENAVEKALEWLATHQEIDGHWDAVKYGVADKRENVSVTALSLLALLSAGHSERVGAYKDNVKRAIAWLDSAPVDGTNNSDFLPAIMAALAVSEAGGMGAVRETRSAAQSMLDAYVLENAPGGKNTWLANTASEADFMLAGWYITMLKSAKVSGLKVHPGAFEAASKFLDNAELKADGKVARYSFGEPGKARSYTSRSCAIGNVARLFLGARPEDVQSSVDQFVSEFGTPTWDAEGKKVDFEYWYFGNLCTFQLGGETWKRWNDDLKKALVENQAKAGDNAGSWEPTGFNAQTRGRVGQTALGALCLETYYRYLRLSPEK